MPKTFSLNNHLGLGLVLCFVLGTVNCAHQHRIQPREHATLQSLRSGSLSDDELMSFIWTSAHQTVRADTVSELAQNLDVAIDKDSNPTLLALLDQLSSIGWRVRDFEEEFVYHHDILSQRTTYLLERKRGQ